MKRKLLSIAAIIFVMVFTCSLALAEPSQLVKASQNPKENSIRYGINELTITKGSSSNLSKAFGKEGKWSVDDQSILVLKKNKDGQIIVKGKKVGTANLHYTVTKDKETGKKSYKTKYTIKVNVVKKGYGVRSIIVPKIDRNVQLGVGKIHVLGCTVKAKDPLARGVLYFSDKKEVAAVNHDGVIRAKKVGQATITVVARDLKTKTVRISVLQTSHNDDKKNVRFIAKADM